MCLPFWFALFALFRPSTKHAVKARERLDSTRKMPQLRISVLASSRFFILYDKGEKARKQGATKQGRQSTRSEARQKQGKPTASRRTTTDRGFLGSRFSHENDKRATAGTGALSLALTHCTTTAQHTHTHTSNQRTQNN